MLKYSLCAIGLWLLLPLVSAQSSSSIDRASAVGSWNNASNPSEHVELLADGRFMLDEYGQHQEGTWELVGKTLLLHLAPTVTGVAQWDGQAFIDNQQKRWVRSAAAPAAADADALTNDDIVKMAAVDMADSKIIQMIQTQPGNYSLTPDSIAALKKQGVSQDVIAAMMAKGSSASPAMPAAGPSQSAAQRNASSAEPACPGSGASYWDGAAWKPMTQVLAEGSSASVRPIPFATSVKSVARFRDPAAPITLGATPKFCISTPFPRNLVVASVDVKSDHREIQLMKAGAYSGAKSGIPDKKLEPVDIKQVSSSVVEVSTTKPLPPGQYIIFPTGQGYSGYDFGVKAGAAH